MKQALPLLLVLTTSPLLAGWIPFTQTARVGPAAYDQFGPVIASNGFDYLVAWTTPGLGVYATGVNSDGTLATEIAMPIDSNAHGVSITPGRDGYFAAWMSDKGLNAAIMDSYGRVERRVTLPQDDRNAQTLAAWNGAVHLVVSGFNGPFVGTLIDNNGEVLQSSIPIGDTHGEVNTKAALTADSEGFLVLSTKEVAPGRDDIYGRRITSSGVAGNWFLVRSVASKVHGLSVTPDDVIAWGDSFGVWMMEIGKPSRQLTPDAATVGQVLRANGRTWITYQTLAGKGYAITAGTDGSIGSPIPLGTFVSRMASNGSRILTVSVSRQRDDDVVGSFVSATSADVPFIVSKSKSEQRNGSLAGDGRNTLAVWDEEHQIFAARFDASRRALDPGGVQISTASDNIHPSAAFNGSEYLIVWTREEQIVSRRFSLDGKVLDTDDIVLGPGTYDGAPRAVWNGSSWLVAWTGEMNQPACGNVSPATRIYATRISPTGVVLDPGGVPIDPRATMDQTDVDLDWNGSRFVIAWTNVCAGYRQPTRTSIGMAIVSPDLSRSDVSVVSTEGSKPHLGAGLIAWRVKGDTKFRLIENAQDASRRRAVGTHRSFPTMPGLLIAVDGDAIFTEMPIPWAPQYQGMFQTTVASDGSFGPPVFHFVLQPSETLMGRMVRRDRSRWMSESLLDPVFDPSAGAQRLWVREF